MAAGTWVAQNKERPGVYVNYEGEGQSVGTLGERGTVTMPLSLSWGPSKQVITVEAGANTQSVLGYSITAPEMLPIREALKRASKLELWRLNAGTQATGTDGANLTATANYGGVRGNDISVVVQENVDDDTQFDVITYLGGVERDSQTAPDVDSLQANDLVTFSGTGTLAAATFTLAGGTDGTTTNQDYADYLEAIEVYDFNTMALPSDDAPLKDLFVSFCKRLRDDEGKKVQVVLENYHTADYEGVISVKNGVVLADGTELSAAQCTAWVAGATAGAQVNQSLTYSAYDGAVDVKPRLTNSQIVQALRNGEFVFTANNNRAVVEQDINTLTSFTPTKPKSFSKNRVIRVLDSINNDFVRIFSLYYIGKVDNNDDGRNLFKGECISYMDTLQGIGAIQNFNSQNDIIVLPGDQIDAVYAEVYIQPVDSIEKIYMNVIIQEGGAA